MTKEELIRYLKATMEKHKNDKVDTFGTNISLMCKDILDYLEQQPSEDKVTITFNKGTLKHSDKDYVVYNKDWFRKHFATEVAIMTGYDGYIEQPTSDDCVSRAEVIDELNRLGRNAFKDDTDYDNFFAFVDSLPPVTPAFSKGATNGDMMKNIFSNVPVKIFEDMNTVIFGNAQFDLDWWNAPYKRGNENEIN